MRLENDNMILEQQNILLLFNTKDSVNMEMAETIAISTGNGRWFNEYIETLVTSISKVLEEYSYYLGIHQYTIRRGLITSGGYLQDLEKESKICACALMLLRGTCWREYYDDKPCYVYETGILKNGMQSLIVKFYFSDISFLDELKNYNISFTYHG